MKVLVVEDDKAIADPLAVGLEREGTRSSASAHWLRPSPLLLWTSSSWI